MPLIQAKCTSCGANLEVNDTQDAAICPFCKTPFVVEKAINNYNTYNSIYADNVIIQNTQKDFLIEAGTLVSYSGESDEVIIPKGPRIIGNKCFRSMNIKSVTIPEGVIEIGDSTFGYCKYLETAILPKSLERINSRAFSGCSSLKSISFTEGLKYIGHYSFLGCSSLKNITIPTSLLEIGPGCFDGTSLEHIQIPEGTKIAMSSFSNTPYEKRLDQEWLEQHLVFLQKINFSKKQKEWYENALCPYCGGKYKGILKKTCSFCGKLKEDSFTPNDILLEMTKERHNEDDFTIENGVLTKYHGILPDVMIPKGVHIIGDKSFEALSIRSVIIPEGVTEIGSCSFSGCKRLLSVILPDTLREIKFFAFSYCTSLKIINLSPNVRYDNASFSSCNNIIKKYRF